MDNRIINRNITRLDNIINGSVPINWGCQMCDYVWKTVPDSIIQGHGCPNCAGCAKLTDDDVDQKLFGRKIKRIESIINTHVPITFQCEKCNLSWKTTPSKILNQETGCPYCNLPGKNEKLLLTVLKENNINYESQFRIKKLDQEAPNYRIDVFIPNFKLAIEYNGKQHYEPTQFGNANASELLIKQQDRDKYVREFCPKFGIELIEIDGRKYFGTKLEKFLIENIVPTIQNNQIK